MIKTGLVKSIVISFILASYTVTFSQMNECKEWQAAVDPKIETNSSIDLHNVKLLSSREDVLFGFECLLKLEGRKHKSEESQVTDFTLGLRRTSPSVEVLALYAISAIYHENWQHSWAIALTENGKKNMQSTIKKAYRSYKLWFEKVKEVGLDEAKKQKLIPLADSDIKWYF